LPVSMYESPRVNIEVKLPDKPELTWRQARKKTMERRSVRSSMAAATICVQTVAFVFAYKEGIHGGCNLSGRSTKETKAIRVLTLVAAAWRNAPFGQQLRGEAIAVCSLAAFL